MQDIWQMHLLYKIQQAFALYICCSIRMEITNVLGDGLILFQSKADRHMGDAFLLSLPIFVQVSKTSHFYPQLLNSSYISP